MQQAIFAAGCFWGVQFYFDQVPGITKSSVGYTGGDLENPTYEDVCSHTTGHAEAILLEFDATVISYETLCKHFFRMHNPTQLNRQGPDVGDSYRSEIFYVTDDQKNVAEATRDDAQGDWNEPIVTLIELSGSFYQAEQYHQKFTERTGRGACHIPYEPIEN